MDRQLRKHNKLKTINIQIIESTLDIKVNQHQRETKGFLAHNLRTLNTNK